MKRLIKKSEFYTSFKRNDEYYEVFINPTDNEVNFVRENSPYNSIRGVVYDDGTLIIWQSEIIHMFINKYTDKQIKINDGVLRFDYNPQSGWDFDGYFYFTKDQLKKQILKHKSILKRVGDISKQMTMGLCSDSEDEREKFEINKIATNKNK